MQAIHATSTQIKCPAEDRLLSRKQAISGVFFPIQISNPIKTFTKIFKIILELKLKTVRLSYTKIMKLLKFLTIVNRNDYNMKGEKIYRPAYIMLQPNIWHFFNVAFPKSETFF